MSTITMNPFLSLNGRAKEAINFYQKHLKGELLFCITNEEIRERLDQTHTYDAAEKDWVSHSVMRIGQSQLMIADDIMSGQATYLEGTNFSFCLMSDVSQEISRMYDSLVSDERTRVILPLAPNFFSEVYAIVEDPFGIVIQLAKEK